MMGGTIGVASAVGQGATFWFTICAEMLEAEETAGGSIDLHGMRVLIVEDNVTNRTILEHQIAGFGAHTDSATDGLGGLAAMYTHLRRPETFGGVLAMSPSFWLGNGAIFAYAEKTSMPWTTKVYLDAGKTEARGMMARDATRMNELLASRGWRSGDQVHLRIDPRGGHNEKSWRRRMTGALRYLLASPHK